MNINRHGAWIYIVWNGVWVQGRPRLFDGSRGVEVSGQVVEHRLFCTVDAAAKYLYEKLVKSGEVEPEEFEEWASCLADNEPGATDCFHSAYPVVWLDPQKEDGSFDIDDEDSHDAWEEAYRGLARGR